MFACLRLFAPRLLMVLLHYEKGTLVYGMQLTLVNLPNGLPHEWLGACPKAGLIPALEVNVGTKK